ncbi:MAG: hypothetical protein FGM24_00260 [Candidatus Kapabacteria bacterium]|nr:hypothetical protein [Candidatus Kapabacteria bacterium]
MKDATPRPGKSSHYMVAHVILPHLLFAWPDTLQHLLTTTMPTFVQELWRAEVRKRGEEMTREEEVGVRVLKNPSGAVAVAIDMPPPETVPEAYAVVMMLAPQRRFFVVERTFEDIIRRYRRSFSWIDPATPAAVDGHRTLGWLCEWLPDRGRRNYEMVDYLDIADVMRNVDGWSHTIGPWVDVTTEATDVLSVIDLSDQPYYPAEVALDPVVAARFVAEVARQRHAAVKTAAEARSRAMEIRSLIERAVAEHGRSYAEITVQTTSAIELLVMAHAYEEARQLVIMWQNFCAHFRGNLAPETMLSRAATALVEAADPANNDPRSRVIYWLTNRDRFMPEMRTDLPGADHPLLSATVDDMMDYAQMLADELT